ncbi:hypothetical protein GCM10011587_25290 [Pyruvatibacter mobilis]|nr:hypothetical protein GCM10011587_25290 [Pyruvatibacter mobilis]
MEPAFRENDFAGRKGAGGIGHDGSPDVWVGLSGPGGIGKRQASPLAERVSLRTGYGETRGTGKAKSVTAAPVFVGGLWRVVSIRSPSGLTGGPT